MKFLTPLLAVLALSLTLFGETPSNDREKIILEGLSQKLLKERVKYIKMAPTVESKPIFEKLLQMYKIDNEIKSDVFEAMQKMNNNFGGIFSELLISSIREEFERLKALNWGNKPHIFYLQTCLAFLFEKPFPGYDSFVENIISDADTMLANPSSEREDPVKLRAEIIGHCILYLAKQGKPGYMKKLENVFLKGEIAEEGKIIAVFMEKKDPAIFEPLSEKILKEPLENFSSDLLNYFQEYAKVIDKQVCPEIKEKIVQSQENARKKAKEILKDF